MRDLKDKEKIVRDLINSFEDRDDLHQAYKEKMKKLIHNALETFCDFLDKSSPDEDMILSKWVNDYVEERFAIKDDA